MAADSDGRPGARATGDRDHEVPRLRLVALRHDEARETLRFHPHLTVLAGFDESAASLVASVLRRADDGVRAVVEVDGERRRLDGVPWELTPPSGELPVVRASTMRTALARLRGAARSGIDRELARIDRASRELEAHSAEARGRLDTIEQSLRHLEARLGELTSWRDTVVAAVQPAAPPLDPHRVRRLLAGLDAARDLPKQLHPEAPQLIEGWEALQSDDARRLPRGEVERQVEHWDRVVAAARERLEVAEATARVDAADRVEAQLLRTRIPEARARAHRRFARARDREELARLERAATDLLARLGVTSLDTVVDDSEPFEEDRHVAEARAVLAAAEAHAQEVRRLLDLPSPVELDRRRADLLERTRRLVGHAADRDPVDALRHAMVEPAEVVEAEAALARELRDLGLQVDGTVEGTARAWVERVTAELAEGARDRDALREVERELGDTRATLRAARRSRVSVTRELESITTELEDYAFEADRLHQRRGALDDAVGRPDLAAVAPAQLEQLLRTAMGLDDGSTDPTALPVVLDDPFTGLGPRLRRCALDTLLRISLEVQVVLADPAADAVEWGRRHEPEGVLVWSPERARAAAVGHERPRSLSGQAASNGDPEPEVS